MRRGSHQSVWILWRFSDGATAAFSNGGAFLNLREFRSEQISCILIGSKVILRVMSYPRTVKLLADLLVTSCSLKMTGKI